MENIELNMLAVKMLEDWDPLGYGVESYDTETADIVATLQGAEDVNGFAGYIQSVYNFSFGEIIPLEKCEKMALQLMTLRSQGSCSI